MCENKKPLARAGHSGQGATFKGDDLSPQNNLSGRPGQGVAPHNNSRVLQIAKILEFLKTGQPLTTLYSRNVLGVCHPAGRINELRKRGYNIETLWTNEIDAAGKVHRVASYVLRPKKQVRAR